MLLLYSIPFEPIFWFFIFSLIGFWVFAFSLVFLWIYVGNLRRHQEGVGICSRTACKRSTYRVEFWLFMATLAISFACMMVLLRFILPRSFVPSTDLRPQARIGGVTPTTASFFIRNPFLGDNASVNLFYRSQVEPMTLFTLSPIRARLTKKMITPISFVLQD